MPNCSEVMNRDVKTVKETDDVFYAARLMREHDVGFLPVCNDAGRITGVLTDRDLAIRVCAADRLPLETTVAEVMTRNPVTCRATNSLAYAERQMRSHGLTRILVVDHQKRVVGVISLSDLAREGRPAKVGKTLRAVAELKYPFVRH